MEKLPPLEQLSDKEKESLIVELWKKIQELEAALQAVSQPQSSPKKTSKNSSIPPSKGFKQNLKRSRGKVKRQASVGRKGGGRELNPNPDQIIIAQVKSCPHCIANLLETVKTHLDEPVQEILQRLQKSRLICSGETGARVQGQNQWAWIFQNPKVCLHVIRPSRGAEVIKEVMGENHLDVWVSNLFSAQKNNPAQEWQVCLAHQLRNCQYAIDAGERVFAPVMKRILLRAFVIHRKLKALKPSTLYQYGCNLKTRLRRALDLNPDHDDGIRLHKRYLKIQDNLFLFLEDTSIPPANNSSEQAIRMSKVFRKVTSCFRSDWRRDLFAAVRSVVSTGARQGLGAYQAITKALSFYPSLFIP